MKILASPTALGAVFATGLVLLACGTNADSRPPVGTGANGTGAGTSMGAVGASGGAGAVGATGGTMPMGGTGAVPSGGVPNGGVGNAGASGTTAGGSTGSPTCDVGTDPGRNQVQPGTVCGRLATIQCASEQYCCPNPGRTFDQCFSEQVNQCNSQAFLDAVSSNPVSGYNVDAAATAFAKFEERACACDATIAQWSISQEGLRGVTLGTRGAGDDCSPAAGAINDPAQAAAALASCTDGASQACLPGGVTGLVWTCAPRGGEGASCMTDLNCIDGFYCDNFADPPALPTNLASPHCQARKPDGSPCGFPLECLSLTCRGGSCVPATKETAYCLAQQ
jgi:hypothetical protein